MLFWRYRAHILLTIMVALIGIGTIWGLRSDRHSRRAEEARIAAIPPLPPPVAELVAGPLSSELPKYKVKAESAEDAIIPWFCRGIWRDLIQADLRQSTDQTTLTRYYVEAERCRGSIDWVKSKGELHLRGRWTRVMDRQLDFLKACEYLKPAKAGAKTGKIVKSADEASLAHAAEVRASCVANLFVLRSAIHLAASPEARMEQADDLSSLAHFFLVGLAGFMGPVPDPTLLIAAGQKILAVDDRVYEAAKSVLVGRLVAKILNADPPKGTVTASWDQLGADLDRVRKINPKDADLPRLTELIHLKGGEPELLKARAEELLDETTLSGSTPLGERWELFEMLGYSEWKLGNHARAQRMLEEALRLRPREKRLQETLERISHPAASLDDYKRVWVYSVLPNLDEMAASLLTEPGKL